MYIKLCDRCRRPTKNKPSFLVPVPEKEGHYHIENEWFGKPVCLCDECIEDFNDFRYNHKRYKIDFIEEINE